MQFKRSTLARLPDIALFTALLAGIALRVALYLQNRNIIVDEANVVRNLHERTYGQLLQPLSYQQFAPKLFLWGLKTATHIGGYSEYALRFIPFISSITALFLFYAIVKRLVKPEAAIYPMLLLSSGFIFIRYATEIKQYATDTAVILALVLLMLRTVLPKGHQKRFILCWALAGSAAIWVSMPSVFLLAGIAVFYFVTDWKNKFRNTWPIILAGVFWIVNFAIYYWVILRTEIHSEYLQNWHKPYFLNLFTGRQEDAGRNADLLLDIAKQCGGDTALAVTVTILLLLAGIINLARQNKPLLAFVATTIGSLFFASAIHQFTLLPRVVLFIMPVLLLLVAAGTDAALAIKYKWVPALLGIVLLINIANYNQFRYLFQRYEYEEFTRGMELAMNEKIDGRHFHVTQIVLPVYLYYKKIHPDSARWRSLTGTTEMTAQTNYDSLMSHATGTNAIIYTWYMDDVFATEMGIVRKNFRQVRDLHFPGGVVYILENKITP